MEEQKNVCPNCVGRERYENEKAEQLSRTVNLFADRGQSYFFYNALEEVFLECKRKTEAGCTDKNTFDLKQLCCSELSRIKMAVN